MEHKCEVASQRLAVRVLGEKSSLEGWIQASPSTGPCLAGRSKCLLSKVTAGTSCPSQALLVLMVPLAFAVPSLLPLGPCPRLPGWAALQTPQTVQEEGATPGFGSGKTVLMILLENVENS